jgi:hypothetical protein
MWKETVLKYTDTITSKFSSKSEQTVQYMKSLRRFILFHLQFFSILSLSKHGFIISSLFNGQFFTFME